MNGTYKIPFFGVDRQYANIREEILEVTDQVYTSGRVLDGHNTYMFEKTIQKMITMFWKTQLKTGLN